MSDSDIKYLLYSFAAHMALLLALTVKVLVFPSVRPEHIRSVRVDLVALPDKLPDEAPPGTPKEKTTEAPKDTPVADKKAMVEPTPEKKEIKETKKETPAKPVAKKEDEAPKKENVKEQQSAALQRLQALAKIKKMSEKKKADDGPEGSPYKGNEISKGSSLYGVEKLQHDQYMENLDLHIKRNWQLPEWLANKELSASLLVRFDENGRILERKFLRSSGNEIFDKEALQAVEASAPFPTPPEALISYFKVRGIELRFPE